MGGEPWSKTLRRWATLIVLIDVGLATFVVAIVAIRGAWSFSAAAESAWWLMLAVIAGWGLVLMAQSGMAGVRTPGSFRGMRVATRDLYPERRLHRLSDILDITVFAGSIALSLGVFASVLDTLAG